MIFESDCDGAWDIFRQRIGQVRPVPVAANPARAEALPQVRPDGEWILYAAAPSDSTSL